MRWMLALVLPFFFPVQHVAAQQVNAAELGAGSLLGGAPSASQSASVSRQIPDYAAEGTLEMGFGCPLEGFRSTPYNSTLSGLDSTMSYYFQDHVAVEGRVTSAWEIHSSNDADAKQVFYGAGLKYSMGNHELQPFVHGLLGGVHMFPQTAFSNYGFAAELGGGVEKKLTPRLWLRLEGDYVRSQLYASGQNNVQAIVGLSYRLSPSKH